MHLVNKLAKKIITGIIALVFLPALLLIFPNFVFAADNSNITNFTNQTMQTLVSLASIIGVLFLVKGGYDYITSQGNPEKLENAKKTIRNAILGIIIITSA